MGPSLYYIWKNSRPASKLVSCVQAALPRYKSLSTPAHKYIPSTRCDAIGKENICSKSHFRISKWPRATCLLLPVAFVKRGTQELLASLRPMTMHCFWVPGFPLRNSECTIQNIGSPRACKRST